MAQGLCFFGMGRLLSAAGVVGAIAILLALAIQGQAESDVWISAFDVDGDEVWPSSSVLATAQLMIQCQAALQWVHPAELMLDVEVEFGRTAWVHANAPSSWRISIEDCLDVGPEGLPQVLTRQIAAGVQASSNAPAHLVQEIPVSGRVSGPETPEGAGHFNGSLAVVPRYRGAISAVAGPREMLIWTPGEPVDLRLVVFDWGNGPSEIRVELSGDEPGWTVHGTELLVGGWPHLESEDPEGAFELNWDGTGRPEFNFSMTVTSRPMMDVDAVGLSKTMAFHAKGYEPWFPPVPQESPGMPLWALAAAGAVAFISHARLRAAWTAPTSRRVPRRDRTD
jgi:hypothetical protein